MPNTEHDYLQQVQEYQHQEIWVWDKVLVIALLVAVGLLVLALAQAGAQASPMTSDVFRIESGQAPPITLADVYPQRFAAAFESDTTEGAVIITILNRELVPCKYIPPEPQYSRLPDGRYLREMGAVTVPSVACWNTFSWQEVWTALPEAGGMFLRRVEEKEK